ncbi:MAG: hypothetical protein DPW14_09600 [Planctomycetes bacterium]|nr:hypothetical protein [Planctomycetota bacterium]
MTDELEPANLASAGKPKIGLLGEPKLIREALAQVRAAADQLYEAAVRPLPEGFHEPPSGIVARDRLVQACVEWQHNLANRFGRFVEEKKSGEVIFSDDSLLQALEYMYVDDVNDESESQIARAVNVVSLIGRPWREIGYERDEMFKTRRPGMELLALEHESWFHNYLQAKFNLLFSRQRALHLVRWTHKAIADYRSISTPRFRITFTGEENDFVARVRVIQAGHQKTRNLTQTPSLLLYALVTGDGVGRETAAIKHDLIEQLPELEPFVEPMARKRQRSNRTTSDTQVKYRITGLPSKNLKVYDKREK